MSKCQVPPPPTNPPGYTEWEDRNFTALRTYVASFFPIGLEQSPLPDKALQDGLDALRTRYTDPGAYIEFIQSLQAYSEDQIKSLRNAIRSIALNQLGWQLGFDRVIDDIPQEVLLRFYDGRVVAKVGGNFWGLVKSVTIHITQQLLASQKRLDKHLSLEADTPIVAKQTNDLPELPPIDQLLNRFRTAITDSIDREIFELKFVQGKKPNDIAKILCLRPMAVYQRIHRMRTKFLDDGLGQEYGLG